MISQRIKNGINKILFTSFVLSLSTSLAFSQAAILLQGVTQFFDNNGNPLTGGFVYTYVPPNPSAGLKTTWKDSTALIPNTNPIVLDSAGRAVIFGEGTYYEVVNDINNNLIWEGLTTPGAASNSGNIGDGLLVGSILPWSGLTAPNQYMFAAAQAISRTTYSVLYTAITLSVSVVCSNGNATVSGLTDTTNIPIGSTVEIPCIAGGTATVSSKTSSTVVLSTTANENATVTAIFYPFGNGDGSTTFNLPDLRGNTMYGNNNMGGTAGSRLTSTYALVNPNALGAVVGGQSQTLTAAQSAVLSYTTTGTAGTFQDSGSTSNFQYLSGSAGSNDFAAGSHAIHNGSQLSGSLSATTSSNAGGGAHSIVAPGITINYIIKVTPDVSGSSISGVASIGGMQGVIACGTGLLCTGNTISVNGGSFANPTASIGLTAVNGTALTGMRSDAAPALSQAIVPTWTGAHTFSAGITVASSFSAAGLVGLPSIASQAANTIVGATAAGSPIALTINSGSSCLNALTWTNGTGFGCNSSAGTGTVTSVGLVSGTATISGTCTITSSGTCPVVSQTTLTAWTPADGSGGSLTFTNISANYVTIGNMVHAYATWTYPSNSDSTNNAIFSGLPITVPNSNYAAVPCSTVTTGGAVSATAILTKNTTHAIFINSGTGAVLKNVNLSAQNIAIICTYPAS